MRTRLYALGLLTLALSACIVPELKPDSRLDKESTVQRPGACEPDCAEAECGPDGCGGSCGTCDTSERCSDGLCDCKPNCFSRACGSDGCGGTCGTCAANQSCNAGKCAGACTPSCSGRICGSDGCGGSCGTCMNNLQCSAAGDCLAPRGNATQCTCTLTNYAAGTTFDEPMCVSGTAQLAICLDASFQGIVCSYDNLGNPRYQWQAVCL